MSILIGPGFSGPAKIYIGSKKKKTGKDDRLCESVRCSTLHSLVILTAHLASQHCSSERGRVGSHRRRSSIPTRNFLVLYAPKNSPSHRKCPAAFRALKAEMRALLPMLPYLVILLLAGKIWPRAELAKIVLIIILFKRLAKMKCSSSAYVCVPFFLSALFSFSEFLPRYNQHIAGAAKVCEFSCCRWKWHRDMRAVLCGGDWWHQVSFWRAPPCNS